MFKQNIVADIKEHKKKTRNNTAFLLLLWYHCNFYDSLIGVHYKILYGIVW